MVMRARGAAKWLRGARIDRGPSARAFLSLGKFYEPFKLERCLCGGCQLISGTPGRAATSAGCQASGGGPPQTALMSSSHSCTAHGLVRTLARAGCVDDSM